MGAILGDIAGSRFEWNRIKTKDFDFFGPECEFTDDSVCTAAVAEILLDDLSPAATLRRWCRRHPGRGYGGMFAKWIETDDPAPYGSFGNGAAMRVSPAAFLHRHSVVEDALMAANRVTAITHNHPEGMKGARATTHAIWLAFQGVAPRKIRRTVEHAYGYNLSRTVDEIRPGYSFDETCQRTVPERSRARSNRRASRTRSATRSRSAGTPTPSRPSRVRSPKRCTGSRLTSSRPRGCERTSSRRPLISST